MNNTGPVIHGSTQRQLERFIRQPSHALQIVGPDGIGKKTIADWLAGQILQLSVERLASYPYYLRVSPTNKHISIDAVREITTFLKLKTVGKTEIRRIVTVRDADIMSREAQNALLKALEEPPADTLFILTVSNPRQLLPTIISRLQTANVHIPAKADLQKAFGDSTKFEASYSLSGGLPGLLSALIRGDDRHPLLEAVVKAKSLLEAAQFDRLAAVDEFAGNKELGWQMIEALERIAQTGLVLSARQRTPSFSRWQQLLTSAHSAKMKLNQNANAKLVFTELFLSLPRAIG